MAGALKARYGLPLPDMFQIAAAMSHPANAFITNDKALGRVNAVDLFLIDEMRALH
jgi:predicted nucleic acid-binding protein